MSSHSISIVPKKSVYPDSEIKAREILEWLVSKNIIKSSISDCILSSDKGYAISEGAIEIVEQSEYLPFDLIVNGLEITSKRQIFHTGQNGMDECICPNCKVNIVSDVWDFLDDWFEHKTNNLTCSNCGNQTEINNYSFKPQWGFSNIGFTFWNWPEFKEDFIEEFQQKLGFEICIVHTHI
ncbi:TFIIB-type zinc ribbon-containing protein [Flavobacterium cheniae]|uniref:Sugar ABC transporter ATPase n=1 Tax=Flavobacterium cheniae TaxID=295428 RepID=A0A562KJ43_9FLAO|nr:TFIIB-type zinc ribbon-containing protein [Flavobacterium cheniae]TDR25830.1 hypothetical protein C8D80_0619 [Flavobacterium cheniae]TWH95439.1 hypothetical protein IP97_01115 [Flavobacterium cheniae]